MSHDEPNRTDRRTFLQAGALATASALSLAPGLRAQDAPAKVVTVPRRPLGKTGVDITMLNQGAVRARASTASSASPSPAASAPSTPPRSTARSPTSRGGSTRSPEVRKEIFLVTKDMPRTRRR